MHDNTNPHINFRLSLLIFLSLLACCFTLLWINHALQKTNRMMSDQLNSFTESKGPPIGSSIPVLRGRTIDDRPVTLDLAHKNKRTLLLVLSPVCHFCKANFPNWQTLLPLIPSDEIVWVDITGKADAQYMASAGIPANSNVIRLDPEERTLYGLSVTPTTVLLDSQGTVKWSWPSVMDEGKRLQLSDLLRLPAA